MKAAASWRIDAHYGAPVLLLGMAMNFLSEGGRRKPGIELTGRQVLRIGVALLGATLFTVIGVSALSTLAMLRWGH